MIVSLQPKPTGGRSTGWKLKTIFAFWHCIAPRQVLIAKSIFPVVFMVMNRRHLWPCAGSSPKMFGLKTRLCGSALV